MSSFQKGWDKKWAAEGLIITHLHMSICHLYPSNVLLLSLLWRLAFKLIFSEPDPWRELWDAPEGPGAVGLHGFPWIFKL